MRLLHFIRRNPWQFITNDEFFLCSSEKVLLETIRNLVEEYNIKEEEIEKDTFGVSPIGKVTKLKRIKFKTVDLKEIMVKVNS